MRERKKKTKRQEVNRATGTENGIKRRTVSVSVTSSDPFFYSAKRDAGSV